MIKMFDICFISSLKNYIGYSKYIMDVSVLFECCCEQRKKK